MQKVNKRFMFHLSFEPQDVIIYDSSREKAIRQFVEIVAPLFELVTGMEFKLIGETEEHDKYVEQLLKEYSEMEDEPQWRLPFCPSELELLELRLEKRNVFETVSDSALQKGA